MPMAMVKLVLHYLKDGPTHGQRSTACGRKGRLTATIGRLAELATSDNDIIEATTVEDDVTCKHCLAAINVKGKDKPKMATVKDALYMLQPATGWCVVVNGEIDVGTVQSTEIGAMVNGLVLHRDLVVRRDMPDDQIRQLWLRNIGDDKRYQIIPIIVTRAASGKS